MVHKDKPVKEMIEKGQRSIFFKSPSIPNDEPVAKKPMID